MTAAPSVIVAPPVTRVAPGLPYASKQSFFGFRDAHGKRARCNACEAHHTRNAHVVRPGRWTRPLYIRIQPARLTLVVVVLRNQCGMLCLQQRGGGGGARPVPEGEVRRA